MTFEDGELFKIGVTVASLTYSVVFGIIAKKVWDVPRTIEQRLDDFEATLAKRFDSIEEDQKRQASRINVHDRISSKVIGSDFDSSSIVSTGIYPEVKNTHAP